MRTGPALSACSLLLAFFLAIGCSESRPPGATGQDPPTASSSTGADPDETAPEDVLLRFGESLERVSVMGPSYETTAAMRREWSSLVDSSLLDRWIAAPAESPGRTVSSPWPARIEISSASAVDSGTRLAEGRIVFASSTGDAHALPFVAELQHREGRWIITRFDVDTAGSSKSEQEASSDGQAAVTVIEEYYEAIDAREYGRAFSLWRGDGPPGQSLEDFTAGFAQTAAVEVIPGDPSRVEGAAGSRFVTVPVTITATHSDGTVQRFRGTYTLQRSVVDGASPNEREWRIARGDLVVLS